MHLVVLGLVAVGEQRLAEAALIVGDEVGGGAEDMRGRAVVALQPDDGGAGKILVEAQDVVDLGAAPAIDGLVVVADAADVDLLFSLTGCSAPAGAGPPRGPAQRLGRPVGLAAFGRLASTGRRRRARRICGRCAKSRSHMYCAVLVSWYSSTRMYLKRLW